MRHPARCVVLATCLVATGSVAHAGNQIDLDDIELDGEEDDDQVAIVLDDAADGADDADGRRGGDAGARRRPTRRSRDRADRRNDARDGDARDRDERDDDARDRDDGYRDERDGRDDDARDRNDRDNGYRDRRRRDEDYAGGRDDDGRDDDDRGERRRSRSPGRRGGGRLKDWHLAIGPYLWASSVQADISIGSASVGSGVDFMDMTRNARFGVEVLAEARYRRFAITADFMYGVIDLEGDKEVGPLMVGVDGSAASLLVDGAAGYMITGGDRALLSLEGRAGVRYQRTAVSGAVGIGGSEVASTEQVMAGADAIVGARVFVRPLRRYSLSSTVDVGVVGDSTLTWSAAVDASARVHSRVLLSLGWRTLTMNSSTVSMVMQGPRAAVQLLF